MLFEGINVYTNESMKKHTTFKIGGNADYFLVPENSAELSSAVKICTENNIPYFVLGNGSNILVSDNGIDGAVISTEKIGNVKLCDDNTVYADAGAKLSKTANFAAKNALSGLETLSGIPGTVGGAVFMNAGAYGGEIKDIVHEVYAIDKNGTEKVFSNAECMFGYRKSIFTDGEYIITGAKFALAQKDKEEILQSMHEYAEKRREKQPLTEPSAGSTFKRPEGYFAGKLIEDSGLKGFAVGGAAVSEKHCGFVVNKGNATCKDVVDLVNHIKKCVHEKFGVDLHEEIRIIGRKQV